MAKVYVDLGEFEDEDLVDELEDRGFCVFKSGVGLAAEAEAAFLALRQNGDAIPDPVREFILASVNRIQ